MRKYQGSILLILIPAFLVLTWVCPAAKAQQGSLRRQTPAAASVGASSVPFSFPYQRTPEQKAHDEEISRWVQRAEKLLDQNDLRGAQQAAEEALKIANSQRPVSFWQGFLADDLAPVYLRSEQYAKAVALFGSHPDLGRNLSLNEAIALVKTHRLVEARKCYRESATLYYHRDFKPYTPGLSSAKAFEATMFLCRGITDVDQNRPMNALWALRHALQLIPRNPLALWYYAEALAATGHTQEARRFYQEAIKIDHGVAARRAREGMARLDHVGGPRL